MSIITPTDGYERPAALGSFEGSAVPVSVTEDGFVNVNIVNSSNSSISPERYQLSGTLHLDLSVPRDKVQHNINFDCFAVAHITGSIALYIGSDSEDKRCNIDKCLYLGCSAETIYISNSAQSGISEIWFFKYKEDN